MLSRAGYRIMEAAGPEEALEAAARGEEPIDLVLTDLVLPGMTGQDLAVKLQAAQPTMKVLYMSGFTIHSAFVEDLSLGSDKIIEKPFRKDLLLKRVREIIEG
jgi:DNA-binding response OmpR family regulator